MKGAASTCLGARGRDPATHIDEREGWAHAVGSSGLQESEAVGVHVRALHVRALHCAIRIFIRANIEYNGRI